MFLNLFFELLSSIYYLALHVTSAGSFPTPLSKKREDELLEKTRNGDLNARNELVEHNLRLVAHIVKKYYTTNCEQDDLISIGTIGLIKAVSSFKSDKGIRLATYAARCIENEILMHFRNLKKSSQDLYISDPIDTDKDGNALTLIDIIADDYDLSEDVDTKIKLQKLRVLLNGTLDKREKEILELRYGLNDCEELTQREIAKKLGISRSYVSRIETAALKKLRRQF
ncbi:MAG: sigma-70 family RNA polymerase sigma factor [Ruminococcaceae bacterium]|nr:sigma-70 family RNA polymerase sigma factor [Oscillospiraceae bacterium]